MSALLLSANEMRELTGYLRAHDQVKWLRQRGWVFDQDARGAPKVAREHFLRQMGGVESKPSRRPQLRLNAAPTKIKSSSA